MKIINSKKGSAMLWTVLLTVILTILLGSIMTAAYAYFNYTMYTVKRQQAYFTARSAISVLLEEFSSEEQVREVDTSTTADGRLINFDGNYIVAGNVCDSEGNVIYSSSVIDDAGRLTQKTNGKAVGTLVRQAVTYSGQYKEESSIKVLPAKAGDANAVNVTDFGFEESMGKATAKITRNEDDEVKIAVTATYADENYEMNATVVRQPIYFGGIAIKNLLLGGNLTLGDSTDLYWNNTELFDPSSNTGSIKNTGNYKLHVQGNLVTRGNARIPAGTVVANHRFYDAANFTNDGLHSKKIWTPSEYIISNKTLLVGETNTEYTSNILNTLDRLTATHTYYCNSTGATMAFGSGIRSDSNLYKLLEGLGMSDIVNDVADDRLALSNNETDALAIQYIEILSLSTTVRNGLEDVRNGTKTLLGGWIVDTAIKAYDDLFGRFAYDTLDVSYIDFSSTDIQNASDEVVPLAYMFVRGGSAKGLTVRVRYGAEPSKRTGLGQLIQNTGKKLTDVITNFFDIDNMPSYVVVYLESGSAAFPSTIHLGYDDDGRRNNSNPADLVFLYSIYGGTNTKVVLHDGVIVVGEIICDNLEVQGNAKVIYSSTSGSQVAKQKIAEYWAVSNYSD